LAGALWLIGGGDSGRPLTTLVVADIVATVVVFAFGWRWNNASLYDPYWSVAPPLIALYWIGQAGGDAVVMRQVVFTTLVFAWGIRLTYNWCVGWPGLHHEDWRYINLYEQAPMPKWAISFLGIHFFPTVVVLFSSLAMIPALARGSAPFGFLDAVALVVTGGAIIIETVADEQLRRFNRSKKSGEMMTDGLWAYSRHPNYFGEVAFWWGLFLFGFAADPSYWWVIIGPLVMTALFHFASIPMLDNRSLERRPGYEEYMRRVNALVPWFPRD
jgi:steroid 5-alpha reductase family enzyme